MFAVPSRIGRGPAGVYSPQRWSRSLLLDWLAAQDPPRLAEDGCGGGCSRPPLCWMQLFDSAGQYFHRIREALFDQKKRKNVFQVGKSTTTAARAAATRAFPVAAPSSTTGLATLRIGGADIFPEPYRCLTVPVILVVASPTANDIAERLRICNVPIHEAIGA